MGIFKSTCYLLLCAILTNADTWQVPNSPASVDLTVLSGDTIRVEFTPPLSDGGSAVSAYKVEWDTDPGTYEIQTVTTSTYTHANEVQVITTSAPNQDEIQLITTSATEILEVQTITTTADSGQTLASADSEFTVTLNTNATGGSEQTSGVIAYNADAEGGRYSVKTILESMSNIGTDGIYAVSRTGPDSEELHLVNHICSFHGECASADAWK